MRTLAMAAAALLVSAPGLSRAQPAISGDAVAGAVKYDQLCAACHGAKARGGQGADLTQSIYAHGSGDDNVIHSIRDGQPDGMPAFRSQLTDADLNDLVAFLKARRADPTNPREASPQAFPPTLPKGVVKTDVERFRVQTAAKTGLPYGFAFCLMAESWSPSSPAHCGWLKRVGCHPMRSPMRRRAVSRVSTARRATICSM